MDTHNINKRFSNKSNNSSQNIIHRDWQEMNSELLVAGDYDPFLVHTGYSAIKPVLGNYNKRFKCDNRLKVYNIRRCKSLENDNTQRERLQ